MTNFLNLELRFILQIVLFTIAIFILLYGVRYLLNKTLEKIKQRIGKRRKFWQESLIEASLLPITVAILFVGFIGIANMLAVHYNICSTTSLNTMRSIGVIIITTWFLLRFIGKIEIYLVAQRKSKNDKASVDAVTKILTAIVSISALLALLDTLGFSIQTVLAFGGLSGIILGFAAKDFISGLYGTFIIYLDKPFVVGDFIRLNLDRVRTVEGSVEKITWRLTQIRSNDKKAIFIPNGQFANTMVENGTQVSHRVFKVEIDMMNDHSDFFHVLQELTFLLKKIDSSIDDDNSTIEINSGNEKRLELTITIMVHDALDKKEVINIKNVAGRMICDYLDEKNIRYNYKIIS